MTAHIMTCRGRDGKPVERMPELALQETGSETIRGLESGWTATGSIPSCSISNGLRIEFGIPDAPEIVPSPDDGRQAPNRRTRRRLNALGKLIRRIAKGEKGPKKARRRGKRSRAAKIREDGRVAARCVEKTIAFLPDLADGSLFLEPLEPDEPDAAPPEDGPAKRYRREDPSVLIEMLRAGPELRPDAMLRLLKFALETIMEEEVRLLTGADRGSRAAGRKARLNGARKRKISTPFGTFAIGIPKLRSGPSYLPSFLRSKSTIVPELIGIVRKAWIGGMSTRAVGGLFGDGEAAGLSKSSVSRICEGIDREVRKFQERRLDAKGRKWVYLWLDATYVDAHVEERVGDRVARRVEKRAIVVAIGVDGRGRRDILGLAVGKSESREFWGDFLLSLKRRGLGDPKLAATDGNAALRAAAREMLPRTDLQLCRVHWMREILGRVPNKRKREVADMLKAIFAQETPEAILAEWNRATAELRRISKAPGIARATADDKRDALLVFARYPKEHWTRISATNIVERQNQEIKRRSRPASIFPNDESIERLVGARMIGTEAKWAMEGHYMLPGKIEAVMNGSAIGPFPVPEEAREAA